MDDLNTLRELIAAEDSDLFDVLEYVSYAVEPITRATRVDSAKNQIEESLASDQREFVDFVLSRYIESGVSILDPAVLPDLLEIKYGAISDATVVLGGIEKIRQTFIEFQKFLYAQLAS